MTLAGALTNHEGALRASLKAEYGLRLLRGGRTEPHHTLTEVADYVRYLPRGCALWSEAGGELAWTVEAHLQREAIFRAENIAWQQAGAQGTAPKRIELPPAAHELRVQQDQLSKKAQAHAERQARKENGG